MTGRGFGAPVEGPPASLLVPPPDITRFILEGETVRYQGRRHPVVLLRPIAAAFAVSMLVGLLVSFVGAGGILDIYLLVIFGAIVWIVYRVIRWGRELMVVTDRRVFEVESIIISRVAIKPVFRQSVVFVQNPLGELLNYGTIRTTTPTGDRVHSFRFVHNPQRFYEAVTDRAV